MTRTHTIIVSTILCLSLGAGAAEALTQNLNRIEGSDDPEAQLTDALLAPMSGITIVPGSEDYQGAVGDGIDPNTAQSAIYTDFILAPSSGSTPTLTLPDGILLTSGTANLPNTNTGNNFSNALLQPGSGLNDSLSALSGLTTNDANAIAFEFTVDPGVPSVKAEFVFGSEEFPTTTNPDIFGFFVDGVNYAIFPSPSEELIGNTPGTPDNFIYNPGGRYPIEYNGLTQKFTVVGLLDLNLPTHTIEIAVADTTDGVWDSGVFIGGLAASPATPHTCASIPLASFSSNFESLIPGPQFSAIGDCWLRYSGYAGVWFGFATQGPLISNLADADGDPGKSGEQDPGGGGNKYLNIYANYNHAPGAAGITTYVYQERTFTAADAALGATWTFSFDYAGAEAPNYPAYSGSAATAAYIRVFEPVRGDYGNLTLTDEAKFDTSAATSLVFAPGEVSLTFDPAWIDGGIVQFGFMSTHDGFEPTGIYYDNVNFADLTVAGGIAVQGVAVQGDANDDGVLNNLDISAFGLALFNPTAYALAFPDVDPDVVLDMNNDGVLSNLDISAFVAAFGL